MKLMPKGLSVKKVVFACLLTMLTIPNWGRGAGQSESEPSIPISTFLLAESGDVAEQFRLGVMYVTGRGVIQDFE